MSGDEDEDTRPPYVEETGPFQPAMHDGIPVALPGEYGQARYGRLSKTGHPPLACPDPSYAATLRGFYRCPACGRKVPLAGQLNAAELGYELADTLMEALIGGTAQAARVIWETLCAAVRGVRWLASRRPGRRENGGGESRELVAALVVMGMVAARNGGRK